MGANQLLSSLDCRVDTRTQISLNERREIKFKSFVRVEERRLWILKVIVRYIASERRQD